MKHFHPKDKELSFYLRNKPVFCQDKFHRRLIEEVTIEGLIVALQKAKVENYDEISYSEYDIVVAKKKTDEEIETEWLNYQVRLSEWQTEYDSKMQILDEAYKKKQELQDIITQLKGMK